MSDRGDIIRGAGGYLKRNTDLGVGIGNPYGGEEGEIRIQMVDGNPKLFARAGGTWYGVSLKDESVEELRIGNSNNYIELDPNVGVKVINDSVHVATFGSTTNIGDTSTEHIKLTSSSMEMKDGGTTMMTLASGNIGMTGVIEITSTGSQNVMIGKWDGAHPDVNGVNNNIVLGTEAGRLLEDGAIENIIIGTSAGYDLTTGKYNTFIGFEAGQNHTVSFYSTCLGFRAGQNITTTGDEAGSPGLNTCVGNNAGNTITTGRKNVCIGSGSNVSATDALNQIAIGTQVDVTDHNFAVIGNSDITRLYAAEDGAGVLYANATIVSSDKRMKENIKDIGIGLDFINKLAPIQYTKKQPIDYEQSLKENLSWYGKKDPRVIEDIEMARIRPGFLAQDVLDVLKELDFSENNGMVNVDDATTQYSMDYASIVVPLTKAVQELSAKITALEAQIN